MDDFELICSIVTYGQGTKALKVAKKNGVQGGTIFLGKGTIKNKILEFLDLNDIRKEIVIMVTEKAVALSAMSAMCKELNLQKPNHGIVFSLPLANFIGTKHCTYSNNNPIENRGVNNPMYNAIFVVVDKGRAEDAVEAATKAGARGGTIINGRGSGIHETNILFSMPIEPEKEIVLILSESNLTEGIVKSIRENLKIDEPGNGVVFTLEVTQTHGLY